MSQPELSPVDDPARHFVLAVAHLAGGDGGAAVPHLEQLRERWPAYLPSPLDAYWLGLAHFSACNWAQATHELRSYVARAGDWRAAWAYLHLGESLEELGRDEEASLAYRGCLSVPLRSDDQLAQQLAFGLMSRIALRGVGH